MKDENVKIIAQLLGSEEEKVDLKRRAGEKGLTVSNFLRELADLPLNQSYAEKGNRRAVGNKGRWHDQKSD